MANIMSLKSLRNKVSRNGFDLSSKRNFTAKAGELLPAHCWEVLPGDSFVFDLKSLTRTQPLNTAAFARIREYYDFYFVPYNLLWNKSNTVLTQMNDNVLHATSLDPTRNGSLSGTMPYTTVSDIAGYLNELAEDNPLDYHKRQNYFGFNRASCSAKLLEYLGYGNFYEYAKSKSHAFDNKKNLNLQLSLFPLLAYQKIYNDYFRQSQWEKSSPSTFNVDYLTGTSSTLVTLNEKVIRENYSMLDLRYCNWQQDLFHGVLPRAQYGDVASVASSLGSLSNLTGELNIKILENGATTRQQVVSGNLSSNAQSQFSILALRQAEFLQRWKEITLSGNKDYKEQIEKHWNVSPSEAYSEMCTYLGGITNSLDINEVVNNNITGDNAADIAGKGVGVSNGQIRFDSNGQYGLIMCIYHCLPLLDYSSYCVSPKVTRVNATDFAIPEFDKVGMQPVPYTWFSNVTTSEGKPLPNFGYAPRYIDYKTDIDQSLGAFKTSMSNWIISYNDKSVHAASDLGLDQPTVNQVNGAITYPVFKVSPHCLDSLFAVSANSSVDTDPFLCSTFFDVKVVRNLDTNGLPY